ncbi:HAD-superfamily hydrolase, subfamily IA, variant 3 [Leptolyngbya sp. NIES-3755]|nr:HAD-superfamily hydrolase, subfamily IA, variant 3 [Leptolyngbya sp. NIES-3755]
MISPPRVVLFDHDGTVVDSEIIALKSAWQLTLEVANEFPGARSYTLPGFIKQFAGKPYREILMQVYADCPSALSEADIQRLVLEEENRAIEHLSLNAKPTAGTSAVLDELSDREIEFALVSNSSSRRLKACLLASELTCYFEHDRVFSAHDSLPVRRPKPLPDIYLHAVQCLNANVANCIAIEDSVSGVKSAIAAEIPLIVGYVGGTHITDEERSDRMAVLQSAGAHQIIEQMPELISLL